MAEYAVHLAQYNMNKQQMSSDRNTTVSAVPKSDASNNPREAGTEQASADYQRIEKKLDFLIDTITTMYSSRNSTPEKVTVSTRNEDTKLGIEATAGNVSFLTLKTKPVIIGLIFSVKLYAVGIDTTAERCRLFFLDKSGEILSESQEIDVVPGEEYNCRFELESSASEKQFVYLAVQGINAEPDEVRQLIEFPVKIAFVADFGL